jgi:hypothetical protein
MLLPITDHLRKFAFSIVSFSKPFYEALKRFAENVKAGKLPAEALQRNGKGLISQFKPFLTGHLKIYGNFFPKNKQEFFKTEIPSNLTPKYIGKTVTIKDLLGEVEKLFDTIEKQVMDVKQIPGTVETINNLLDCFNAIDTVRKDCEKKFYNK